MSKKFDCPDGTLIEVFSDNAVRWQPDTCDCIVVYESDTQELDFIIQVCQEHKLKDKIKDILKTNNDLNKSIVIVTEADELLLSEAKKTEKQRIKDLGPVEIQADSNTKQAIEDDLRLKGR